MYSRNDDFTYDSQGRIEPTYENLREPTTYFLY